MDALLKSPFTVAMLVLGAVLLFFGLGAELSLGDKEIKLPAFPAMIIAILVGVTLIVLAVFLELRRSKSVGLSRTSQGIQAADFFCAVGETSTSFRNMVNGASRVEILAITGVTLLSTQQGTFEELLQQGCEIHLLFLDPLSDAAKIVYGGKYDRYKSNIDSSGHVLSELRKKWPAKISVRAVSHAPTVSMIFVHHERKPRFLQVQLYFLRSAIGADRPVFRVTDNDRWFAVFEREYRELWNTASEWSSAKVAAVVNT